MNLNKSAMLKAVGLSILISIVVGLILGLIGVAAAPDSVTTANPNMGVLGDLLSGASIVAGVVGLVLMLLTGALYGYFARREGTPVDTGNYAVGGALTVIVLYVINLILALILGAIGLAVPGVSVADAGVDAGTVAAALTVGAIVGLLVNAVIGAIGGVIYAAVHRDSVTTPYTGSTPM